MLDLTALPKRYLEQLGKDMVAEIVGVPARTVAKWGTVFPVEALQKLLAADPTPLHEVHPLYPIPPPADVKLSLIVPSALPVNNWTRKCIDKLIGPGMEYEPESFNSLYHVRNMAAGRFLRSGREWSAWMDADMLVPCGDAAWYKKQTGRRWYPDVFAGMNTIYRLMAHKKSIVSVVYIEKTAEKPHVMFEGGDDGNTRMILARGPHDAVRTANWCGFGFVLIHRSVFEDIIKAGGAPRLTNQYMRQKLGCDGDFSTHPRSTLATIYPFARGRNQPVTRSTSIWPSSPSTWGPGVSGTRSSGSRLFRTIGSSGRLGFRVGSKQNSGGMIFPKTNQF